MAGSRHTGFHPRPAPIRDGHTVPDDTSVSTKPTGIPYATVLPDKKTLSFAGRLDYRVDMPQVAAALDTPIDKLCFPLLVRDRDPTAKDYTSLCLNPAQHGEFGSDIHSCTMGLRAQFKQLKAIDFSHAPQNPNKGAGKGAGPASSASRDNKRHKGKGGKGRGF